MTDITIPSKYKPWLKTNDEILSDYKVDPEQGLEKTVVEQRRRKFGDNQLRSQERHSPWRILIEQFDSVVIWLLMAAVVLSFIFGEWVDGIAVLVVVVINALIGFVTEYRAVRSMEALRDLGRAEARVLRNGDITKIPADQIVPGDVLVFRSGDIVTADVRLIEGSKLQANESALTGESIAVSKKIETLEGDVPLAERKNMLFKGTSITRGAGRGIATHTGMETELGHITSLVQEAEAEVTPLEKRLNKLGQNLVWLVLGIIVIVALVGIIRGKEILLMIETSVALAVAAVPEGLPIVATVALARGMKRMVERNALINRLASVETLGGTNVICADKTGTLTENQMTVTNIVFLDKEIEVVDENQNGDNNTIENHTVDGQNGDSRLTRILKVGVLCNNASINDSGNDQVGEPLEIALLNAGKQAGLIRDHLLEELPEKREVAFDPEVNMMATFHQDKDQYYIAVKGAPEAVLSNCVGYYEESGLKDLSDQGRQEWIEQNKKLAQNGLRVIALADKNVAEADLDPYRELNFIGLMGMKDPPRKDIAPSIQNCKNAGVRVIMVTGDHASTARNISDAIGLTTGDARVLKGKNLKSLESLGDEELQEIVDADIFARVSPKQKLDLIAAYQSKGLVVAMTGDGVNDAPALKKSDIGIAMGKRGTQVAKEASDMILLDDAFSSIVEAIRLGRVIYNNIRRFVVYLLSCNISEISVVFLASIVNAPLPIRPLQILFLNLVTDVFPALALGVGKGDPSIMERPPRDPDEPILTQHHWFTIGGFGVLITIAVLIAFALALLWQEMTVEKSVSVSFLTLAFAQLWHVFNMRDSHASLFRNDVVKNAYIWLAVLLCTGLLLAAVYFPPLAQILSLVNPGVEGWGIIAVMSLIPLVLGQLFIELREGLNV